MSHKYFKLLGYTKTPIVSRRRHFGVADVGAMTINGRPRVFGKLTVGQRRAPMTFRAWYGNVEFIVPEHKLEEALAIDSVGSYTCEGMGQISWTSLSELKKNPLYTSRRIKIRKKLSKLSDVQETLVIAMLLHDFVNTDRHQSKIYSEVNILNEEVHKLVKNHHDYDLDKTEFPLLPLLQYYDRLSSSISRKFRWSASSRYRVTELEKIDFDALKREIEKRQYSPYALYTFILKCQTLDKINEALKFGFSSLKNHLLLMVNLYLDDLNSGL
jgi:hypothetical protein